MISNATYRKRKQERAIVRDRESDYAAETNSRIVDFGITLRVVVPDPAGRIIVGDRLLRVAREHHFGWMIDTTSGKVTIAGPSLSPVIWHCSLDQEQVLLHADAERPAQLVYGSEGAGKTTVLAMWHALKVLSCIGEGRQGGQTAPTEARLESILNEMRTLYPGRWYSYRSSKKILEFVDGTTIRLISTHKRSNAAGSPLQSYNWSWAGDDEIQDSIAEVDNVTARLRSAKGGSRRAPRIGTATAKDATEWRNLRDKLEASGIWIRRTLLGRNSPFIAPEHWDAMKATMSDREYQRRVLAMDVGPERMVYTSYDRTAVLRAIPEIGWTDVTARELSRWGTNFAMLGGHDPGALYDVTLLLRAYERNPRQRPWWFVVGEVTTEQTTTEQHVVELLKVLRGTHRINMLDRHDQSVVDGPRILIRADPYGNNDSKPDRSCYTVFRNAGMTIHPAAYAQDSTKPGRVPKEAGIDLVNTLLRNAAGEHRLFIALDENHQPVAPRLVKSLESSARDGDGRAEMQHKDYQDLSHWTAALRYALWAVERPRLVQSIGVQA